MGAPFSKPGSVDRKTGAVSIAGTQLIAKLKHLDWKFIKGSSVLSVGLALARLLGLAFSLILARSMPPADYGYVQYIITLSSIVALGIQPFGQHVMARYVGKYKDDSPTLDSMYSNLWAIMTALFLGTFLIAIPILIVAQRLSLEVLVVFTGITFFYSYYGLSRGFMASYRLLAAFLGSNLVQLLATMFVIFIVGNKGTSLPLLIYGLSYFLPLLLLQIYKPFPLHLKLSLINRSAIIGILKFSAPVLVSHICFVFYQAADVLFLEHGYGNGAVGVYSLSKTLSAVFSFVPLGVTTILLPRVAGTSGRGNRKLLMNALVWDIATNGVLFLLYVLTYNLVVQKIFGTKYYVGIEVFGLVALGNIIYGIHTIISSVLVGSDRARMETISLIIGVTATVISGWILVPLYGLGGAALMTVVGAVVPLTVYAYMILTGKIEKAPEPAPAE